MTEKVKFDDFGQNIETEDTKIQEVNGTLGLVVQTISSSVNQPEIKKLVGQEFIPLSLGEKGDQEAKNNIKSISQNHIESIGISEGAVHLEYRINKKGIHLIDISGRSIGGHCSQV